MNFELDLCYFVYTICGIQASFLRHLAFVDQL